MYREYPVLIRDVTAAQFAVQATAAPAHPGLMYRVDGTTLRWWDGSQWLSITNAAVAAITGGTIDGADITGGTFNGVPIASIPIYSLDGDGNVVNYLGVQCKVSEDYARAFLSNEEHAEASKK